MTKPIQGSLFDKTPSKPIIIKKTDTVIKQHNMFSEGVDIIVNGVEVAKEVDESKVGTYLKLRKEVKKKPKAEKKQKEFKFKADGKMYLSLFTFTVDTKEYNHEMLYKFDEPYLNRDKYLLDTLLLRCKLNVQNSIKRTLITCVKRLRECKGLEGGLLFKNSA